MGVFSSFNLPYETFDETLVLVYLVVSFVNLRELEHWLRSSFGETIASKYFMRKSSILFWSVYSQQVLTHTLLGNGMDGKKQLV